MKLFKYLAISLYLVINVKADADSDSKMLTQWIDKAVGGTNESIGDSLGETVQPDLNVLVLETKDQVETKDKAKGRVGREGGEDLFEPGPTPAPEPPV